MTQSKRRKEDSPPSREFLTCEKGAIQKKWHSKTPVCIVFPNSYYIGMSNLALHILYTTLNSNPNIVCERCFFEENDAPCSLESGKPLASFDLIFVTLSFELDFVNIPKILNRTGLAALSSERKDGDPLVIAGGICVMANPEPVNRFIDLFILGDVEATIPLFMERYSEAKGKKRGEVV